LPYRLPGILHKGGVLVGLTYNSLQSSRNLPFFAGTASNYGMDKEEALKLITSNTAKILGIEDRTGMLKEGLDANIVVSEGDLLDMRTNKLVYAFIEGRQLMLDGKQQALFDRFKKKYESKK
ncbi:MAG: amidohydrolase family protein, partial [Cyclobacteriaceae bacterium]